MARRKIGVIGGGASGMTAAIIAARQGAHVTIFEGNDRLGKKLLATGNGRCNLGNLALSADCYYGGDAGWIWDRISAFCAEDAISFFQGLGLMVKEKNGCLYPACEQALAVVDVLHAEIKSLGIKVKLQCKVERISKKGEEILLSDGKAQYRFDRVIIACGGRAAPKTGSDGSGYLLAKQLGHSIVPTVPALVQLRCKEAYFKAIAGVRAQARAALWQGGRELAAESGELQITDYGLSGIPIFQLSRIAGRLLEEGKEAAVHINFLYDLEREAVERMCAERSLLLGDRTVGEFFTGMLHPKIMRLFTELSGLRAQMAVEDAPKEKLWNVFSLCRDWEVTVTASNPYENAQVCAGGVPVCEVTQQLESVRAPGVYFAGEVLDVDGKCGGYNLHWAWCSGHLAGRAAACETRVLH